MGKHKQKIYCIICDDVIFNRKDNALYCNECKIKQHKIVSEKQILYQHCKKHLRNLNMRVNKILEWELIC